MSNSLSRAARPTLGAFVLAAGLSAAVLAVAVPNTPLHIHVRWPADVSSNEQLSLEQRFHLEDRRVVEGTTWAYRLADRSRGNIRALVEHPRVEDTQNLDRTRFRPVRALNRAWKVQVYALMVGTAAAALVFFATLLGVTGEIIRSRIRSASAAQSAASWFALGIASAGFGFRFLTLRDFPNDHYMHLVWAQQLLFGDLPNRDFIDPGFPLTYTLSALVQYAWPAPLSEALLAITMLSIAAALTLTATCALTGSLPAGVVAATAGILMQPRLYNYPKLLVPAVALWLFARYTAQPTRLRVVVLGVWTTVSFLLRHDLGLYVAVAVTAGLITANWHTRKEAVRRTALYVASGLLTVLPYLVWVQLTQGIATNVRDAFQFFGAENPPMTLGARPDFPFLASFMLAQWTQPDSVAMLFYIARLAVPTAMVVLVIGRHNRSAGRTAGATMAVVLLTLYDAIILRHPLTTRLPDLAVPLPVVTVWIGWSLLQVSARALRPLAVTSAALIAVVGLGTVSHVADVPERLRETNLFQGPAEVARRAATIVARASTWSGGLWPAGTEPAVVDYVRTCTASSDRLLVTWPAPEYYFFSRRPFASGHALLFGFSGEGDQQLMVSRLQQERVPLVLVNEERREDFVRRYPLLNAYVEAEYDIVGHDHVSDELTTTIAVRRDLVVTATYGSGEWPCGLS